MRRVENVDLREAERLAQSQVKDQALASVATAIKGVLVDYQHATATEGRLEKDLAKAKGQREKLRDLIVRIQAGEWDAIPESKDKGEAAKKEN